MIKRFLQLFRRPSTATLPKKKEDASRPPVSEEASDSRRGPRSEQRSPTPLSETGAKSEKKEEAPRAAARDSAEPAAAPEEMPSPSKPKKRKKRRWKLEDFPVEPEPGKTRFHDIGLPLPIMHAIADLDFHYCTPVQAESLPPLLQGRDLVGQANTGTGKTAVFLIAIFTRLLQQKKNDGEGAQALVIAPTRELVIQIAKDAQALGKYCRFRVASVYGGTGYKKQMEFLENKRCDIVVATPGRLLDFCGKGVVKLESCHTLVIDEADRMLDMGFIPDVRRIINRLPKKEDRQTLLFSATITDDVRRLAYQWCTKPANVAIEPDQVAVESVEQKVYLVTSQEKYSVLYNVIKSNEKARIAVFTNQKVEARKLYERLQRNSINCTLLSGDVPQNKRTQRLERFRSGDVDVLVATDVAGRGIHIDGITHVVNFTLPYEPEDYVHRIGRTGRAGEVGVSISFACEEESFVLPEIEEFIGEKLECSLPPEELLQTPPKGSPPKEKGGRQQDGGGKRKGRGRSRHRSGQNSAGKKTGAKNGPRPGQSQPSAEKKKMGAAVPPTSGTPEALK